MFRTASLIAQEEGVTKLWRGVTPAVMRHCIYSGIRMGTYESLRDKVFTSSSTGGSVDIWKLALAAGFGGAVGQFFASPTDLVKVQMQMEGKRRLDGLPPRVKGVFHAFRTIVAAGGFRGLWKGWVPNCQRAALANMADIPAYDKTKKLLLAHTSLGDTIMTHTVAATIAGLSCTIACTPPDVIKTGIMNQPTDQTGQGLLYRSSGDCLSKTVKQEGFFALYKGFLPAWLRLGPWTLIFYLTYEQVRRASGTSTF